MTLNANTNIWKEIFQIIQNHPAIWKIKSTEYRNIMKKNQAWESILEKYKEIDPDGTLATIKNKITNIRTCYRRDLKKVADSLKSGAGGEDVYIPSLWYFYELDFLRDQEEASESVSTVDFDVEALKEIRPKRSKNNPKQDFLQQACAQLESMKKMTMKMMQLSMQSPGHVPSGNLTLSKGFMQKKALKKFSFLVNLNN
ncbi:uncharacterized protein LOC129944930 [Eupeodes corollae]|uniref:uncharacterized protein LOC129944930 n=1 Tax=Eupeodes corollae TaxID=290404 RepID=UPI0024938B71|nr:uncharacterized protein LOC129944930 [Eupeodes corollae]